MNINKVIMAGRLTKSPELKQTQSGTNVCNFAVALNKKYKKTDGKTGDITTFVECTAINKVAEAIKKYFDKGDEIYIEGELRLNQWKDAKTNAMRQKTYVLVSEFQFTVGKKEDKPQGSASTFDDDETPF